MTRLGQLRWIQGRTDGPPRALAPGSHSIDSVGEGIIVGVHGLEPYEGRSFRWSEPVLTMLVESPGLAELRIDTGLLRGTPLDCVIAAYVGSRRLGERELREDGSEVVVAVSGGPVEVTLLCRPLAASDDERDLGLPIFSVEVRDRSRPAGRSSSFREPAVTT
jgi:hypothetical protein